MHLILTGATGFIGSIALDLMIKDANIDKVTIISRKPVKQGEGHSKVEVILHQDLAKYDDETLWKLRGAHGCIWALGPPYMSVSKEEYEYAHIELPAIAAKIYSTLDANFNFVYVSHDKCDEHKGVYGYDIKNRAEEAILKVAAETPSLNMFAVRPALIDYSKHDAIKPYIKYPLPFSKLLTQYALIPLFRFCGSPLLGTSQDLGLVMVDLAAGNGTKIQTEGAARGGRCIGVAAMAQYAGEKRRMRERGVET